jgi:zinc transport system permease protein
MLSEQINNLAKLISGLMPAETIWAAEWRVFGLFAVMLIGLVCGAVGSLVVGNRMAFFSDALAHCAFAGVALGLMLGVVTGAGETFVSAWLTTVMVGFGIVMGLLIALVRDKTGQASDTVIGVFFAGAIGLGAIFLKAGASRRYMQPEDFMFGDLNFLLPGDIVELFLLAVVVAVALVFLYNRIVLASFNPSLARSRGIHVTLCGYLFIVLLALIVNICLKTVGVLLINALLIVPAAAAANLTRNMRQLFVMSMLLCMGCGVGGLWLSWEISNNTNLNFSPGESGTIVVLAVSCYVASIFLSPWLRNRKHLPRPEPTVPGGSTAAITGSGEPAG